MALELDEQVFHSLTELVGNTPLLELHHITKGLPSRVLLKLEGRNPGGSAKDRIALNMIRAAEASGELKPGATIVESTSGNTGIGLALMGRLTGHPVVIVHNAEISAEKRALLRAYGARTVVADWGAPPENPANPRAIATKIAAGIENAWRPQQFDNPNNPAAHTATTGPEIWRQTGGKVTHFVAAIGTGGTVTGTGRFLKKVSAGRVQVIGVDPAGSTYSGQPPGIIVVDGVGTSWPESHWPTTFDHTVVDGFKTFDDGTVFSTLHRLVSSESLLLGPSSGLAVAAALDVARDAPGGSVIVVVSADNGVNYLTKAYDDDWLASEGLPPVPAPVEDPAMWI